MNTCYTILPRDRNSVIGLDITKNQSGDIVFRTERAAKKFFLEQRINKNRYSIFEIQVNWMEDTIPGELFNILIVNAPVVRKIIW